MPPAAMTGMSTASTTWGTRAMVVVSPTWPPLSVPSAMTASAPRLATSLARATAATTGITLAPDSFQAGMNRLGSPAPVVMTATFSSAAMAASCSTWG